MSSSDPSPAVWSTRWQEAWNAAQPRISSIRASYRSDDAPASRPLRVNQLDSELLDQQLVHLLCEPLQKAVGAVNVRTFLYSVRELTCTKGNAGVPLRAGVEPARQIHPL